MVGDRAPFSLTDLVSHKDSIHPASGPSHTPNPKKTYPSLEQLIPPLEEEYGKITREIMWQVHQKAKQRALERKAAAAAGSSLSTTTTPKTTPAPFPPTVSQANTPYSGKGSKKTQKQQKRKKLEKLCDGYKLLEGDQGLVVEDEKGVPLLVVVRNVLPQDHNVGTFNISLIFCWIQFPFSGHSHSSSC